MSAKKVFEVALILSASDQASKVVAASFANSKKSMESMSKMGDTAFGIGRGAGKVGLGFAAALALPLKAAADMESMNIALKTSFQNNAKAAGDAFRDINKFAAQTPYELEEVMTGFIKLKNMGLDPGKEALTAYGNTASAMGKSLNDMVEAVADAATGEFERLKEFGIKAKSEGDNVTFTFQGVKTTVGKNSKEIEQYLKYIGNVKFKGGIEAQSKSIKGQLSTLKDGIMMTAAKLGSTLIPKLNELFAKVSPVIDKVSLWVDKNPQLAGTIMKAAVAAMALSFAISATAFAFGGLFKIISFGMGVVRTYQTLMIAVTAVQNVMAMSALAGSGALTTLTAVVTALNLAFLANPITWIVLGIVALVAAGYLLIKNWTKVKDFFVGIFDYIRGAVSRFFEVFSKTWLKYTPVFLIYNNWGKISTFFSGLFTKVKTVFLTFFTWFYEMHKKFFEFGVNIVAGLWKGITSKLAPLLNFVKDIGKKIASTFKYVLGIASPSKVFMDYGVNITDGAKKGIEKGSPGVVSASKGMGKSIAPNSNRSSGGSGGAIQVTFAPTINGGGDSASILAELKKYTPQLIREIESALDRKSRLAF